MLQVQILLTNISNETNKLMFVNKENMYIYYNSLQPILLLFGLTSAYMYSKIT